VSRQSLHGDIADQTGGARGIGLEVSRALAGAGANVCLVLIPIRLG
jgi:NAD(P)-dependent dehydrogenase (short-subunit alcohol dehydrogenase family)